MPTQKGLYLRAATHRVSEIPVKKPHPDHCLINPKDYAEVLKDADPEHLLLAAVPFSEAAGQRVLLIYDAANQGPPNAIATRLTTGVEDGLEVQVKGDALAFYAQPGRDLGEWEWQQLDNAIYDLMTCSPVAQGKKPTPADIEQLVEGFKEGRFDYNKNREGEEGEDVNKDDAGEDLQDALGDS